MSTKNEARDSRQRVNGPDGNCCCEHPTTASHGVKPLPTIFRSDGFTFRQLWREGRITLFETTADAEHHREP